MSFWTPEKADRAERLYLAGRSADQIAKALGATRNAVLGKLHRKGVLRKMKGRRNIAGQGQSTVSRSRFAPRKPLPAIGASERIEVARKAGAVDYAARAAAMEVGGGTVALLDRQSGQCAWIVGKTKHPALCCGAAVDPNAPRPITRYCRTHGRIAISAVKPKSAEALERDQSQMARAA